MNGHGCIPIKLYKTSGPDLAQELQFRYPWPKLFSAPTVMTLFNSDQVTQHVGVPQLQGWLFLASWRTCIHWPWEGMLSLIMPVNKKAVTLTAAGNHLKIPRAASLGMKQMLRLEWQILERNWILGDIIGLLNGPALMAALPLGCQVIQ